MTMTLPYHKDAHDKSLLPGAHNVWLLFLAELPVQRQLQGVVPGAQRVL